MFHLILATPIGSLKSYIQTCGRVIRKSPQTPDYVLITDHAGSFFEHGSPNEDRDWQEIYTMSEGDIRAKRKAQNVKDAEKGEEPICCPKCGTVLRKGKCPPEPFGCGEPISVTNPNRMRTVIQEDGTLAEVENISRLGAVKKRASVQVSSEQKQWNAIFWGAKKSERMNGMTFKQARCLYFKRYGTYPPDTLKFMPRDKRDYERRIRAVDMRSLHR
jgi:superfamily II DNA or RNA helicase